jgi:ADP-ribose pyrophosphatase YjhB (NUDIX family)
LKKIPHSWKQAVSRLMHLPFMLTFMKLGIWLVVPKQRVGTGVVVMDDRGRVLLLNHVFHPVFPWDVPGGWLNRNEDPAVGALRELWEETGITAELGPVVRLKKEDYPDHLGIAFLAFANPQPMHLSNEILEARWFEPDALPEKLVPFSRAAIETAVSVYKTQFAGKPSPLLNIKTGEEE